MHLDRQVLQLATSLHSAQTGPPPPGRASTPRPIRAPRTPYGLSSVTSSACDAFAIHRLASPFSICTCPASNEARNARKLESAIAGTPCSEGSDLGGVSAVVVTDTGVPGDGRGTLGRQVIHVPVHQLPLSILYPEDVRRSGEARARRVATRHRVHAALQHHGIAQVAQRPRWTRTPAVPSTPARYFGALLLRTASPPQPSPAGSHRTASSASRHRLCDTFAIHAAGSPFTRVLRPASNSTRNARKLESATAAHLRRQPVPPMSPTISIDAPASRPERMRLPVPCSLFPVPCSLFPVPCSLFPVPCQPLRPHRNPRPHRQPPPRPRLIERTVHRVRHHVAHIRDAEQVLDRREHADHTHLIVRIQFHQRPRRHRTEGNGSHRAVRVLTKYTVPDSELSESTNIWLCHSTRTPTDRPRSGRISTPSVTRFCGTAGKRLPDMSTGWKAPVESRHVRRVVGQPEVGERVGGQHVQPMRHVRQQRELDAEVARLPAFSTAATPLLSTGTNSLLMSERNTDASNRNRLSRRPRAPTS